MSTLVSNTHGHVRALRGAAGDAVKSSLTAIEYLQADFALADFT